MMVSSRYRASSQASLKNNFVINPGDRIAQFMLIPVIEIEYDFVKEFKTTERSSGGFGHSGTN